MKAAVAVATVILGLSAAVWAAQSGDHELIAAAANLGELHRVTEQPFQMDHASASLCRASNDPLLNAGPHEEMFCHVYVSKSGVEAMESGEHSYPAGTVIVKQKFSDKEGKNVELFTLMRKMKKGYDRTHSDWEYSIVDGAAKTVLSRGRTESCLECHRQYAATDYVTRAYMPPDEPKGNEAPEEIKPAIRRNAGNQRANAPNAAAKPPGKKGS